MSDTCQVCGGKRYRNKKATINGVKYLVCIACSVKAYHDRDKARKIPAKTRKDVYAACGKQCKSCGSTADLTLDHIKPVSHGGESEAENLQVLCRKCNSKKGMKIAIG